MSKNRKVIITCAVTGAIHTPSMSPHLPITADEIVEAAVGAAEAGAALVHVHARNPKTGQPFGSQTKAFAEWAAQQTEIAGVQIPSGARVLVIYASANRDEREWENPEVFDIRRDAGRHVGFGHGAHACAGQGLARLETTAMLRALLERVDRIELTGTPTWAVNNIIRRYERLPLKLIAA